MVGQWTRDCVQIRQRVVVRSRDGVVGVRPVGDVHDGPYAVGTLLGRRVGERLTAAVLRVVHRRGCAVDEPNHGVFPVPHVVAELECRRPQDPVSLVVGVEVEVKRVESVVGFGHRHHRAADDGGCAAIGLRAGAPKPRWKCLDAFVGSQVHVYAAVREGIQAIEVGQGQGCRRRDGVPKVVFRMRMGDLRPYVAGKIYFRGAKVCYGR